MKSNLLIPFQQNYEKVKLLDLIKRVIMKKKGIISLFFKKIQCKAKKNYSEI